MRTSYVYSYSSFLSLSLPLALSSCGSSSSCSSLGRSAGDWPCLVPSVSVSICVYVHRQMHVATRIHICIYVYILMYRNVMYILMCIHICIVYMPVYVLCPLCPVRLQLREDRQQLVLFGQAPSSCESSMGVPLCLGQ